MVTNGLSKLKKVKLNVNLPKNLTKEEEEIFKKLQNLRESKTGNTN